MSHVVNMSKYLVNYGDIISLVRSFSNDVRTFTETSRQNGVMHCLTSAESDEEAPMVIRWYLRSMNLQRYIHLLSESFVSFMLNFGAILRPPTPCSPHFSYVPQMNIHRSAVYTQNSGKKSCFVMFTVWCRRRNPWCRKALLDRFSQCLSCQSTRWLGIPGPLELLQNSEWAPLAPNFSVGLGP